MQAVYGKYQWQTFTEVYERIKKVADGLALIGMKPKQKIAIFLETKAEWMIAIQVIVSFVSSVEGFMNTEDSEGHRLLLN